MHRNYFKPGLTLLGALGFLTSAFAAEDTSGTLEEVVVTAQKRVESVQTVPVSITVISNEQLLREGIASVADLQRTSASIEFGAPGTSSPGGGGFVRGIGTNSFGYSAQASVGIVLDGVVMGNANILSLFDLNRVEVLKGPQGTMFGNSVSAGVINITTKAPDPSKKEFIIDTEFGSGTLGSDYSRYQVRAAANLPLSGNSALRISVHSDQNDGVFQNVNHNDDSSSKDSGVRARFMAKPSDAFTVNLIADYNKLTESGVPTLTWRVGVPGSGIGDALTACGVTPGPGSFQTCSPYDSINREVAKGASAQFDWAVGGNTLTSISSYRARYTGTRNDIVGVPHDIYPTSILTGGFDGLQEHHRSQYSEELRLASAQNKHLEWVAGVFYQDFKDDISEPGVFWNPVNNGFAGTPIDDGKWAAVKTTDYAAFGNLTYYFSDAWRLIAGARYTHSKVSESETQIIEVPHLDFPPNAPPVFLGLFPATLTGALSTDASKFSYRLGVQHDLSAHTMAYLTVATGYKGPQINDDLRISNPSIPNSAPGMYAVDPEIPTSYELGIKTSVLENRLAIDADVFYTKVKNYQGQQCVTAGGTNATPSCGPANVPSVTTKGVELDIFGRPIKGLTLNLTGIYNPAEYPAGFTLLDDTGTIQQLGGYQLPRSSRTKYTLSGEYEVPVGGNYSFVIGADTTYRSSQRLYPSAAPQYVVPSGNISNARIGLKSSDEWSVYLFGRNLGNTHFPRDLFPFLGDSANGQFQVLDASARKLVGVQFSARF